MNNQLAFTIHDSSIHYIADPQKTEQLFDLKQYPTQINRKLMNKALHRLLACRKIDKYWYDIKIKLSYE